MKLSLLISAMRRRAALDLDVEDPEGVKRVVTFMASQVPGLDDKSVCYGFYTAIGVYEPQKEKIQIPFSLYITPLMKKLAAEYQERLVKWFEYALIARSHVGGGGVGIKKVEAGLAAFVEAIPRALAAHAALDLKQFVPDTEYFDNTKLTPLGAKILKVVQTDAQAAGVLGLARAATFREASTGLSVVWDPKDQVWYIPPTQKTYELKDQLGRRGYGFSWDGQKRRWEIKSITPQIQKEFEVPEPEKMLQDWFWDTWYPKNYQRFTQAFTNFARNLQSSYKIEFSTNRKQLAKFSRNINSVDDAIEELRYRYLGRQGRQPWLKVMNEFLLLRDLGPTNTDQIIRKIDLLNGLQHSNGLFMELFPPKVKVWYKAFLNAKFAAPDPEDLARYIPDKDLKELLLFHVSAGKARPLGKEQWSDDRGEWQHFEKEAPQEEVNWRQKGYPRLPGDQGRQRDRLGPEVQEGLRPKEWRDPALMDLWKRRKD